MPGWNIKRSFFLYTTKSDDTNFGIKDNKYHQDFPLLDFRVDIQRDFFNIFVITLIIPMIVVLLLFLIQWIVIKKIEDNNSYTTLDMISAGSSLVFIMILEQINVRQNIATSGIIYIDYCYFIFYLLILAVVINGALFASDLNIRWIEYKQNLLAKLLFWPSLNILLLIVTLFIFY